MRKWWLLAGAIVTEVTGTLALAGAADHVWLYAVTVVGEAASFYLLIKVHKPKGLCGRPIVPCTRWITTPASVLVDHLLQEIVKKANIPWLVKDTKSFVNELEHKRVHQRDGVFVTADIASPVASSAASSSPTRS